MTKHRRKDFFTDEEKKLKAILLIKSKYINKIIKLRETIQPKYYQATTDREEDVFLSEADVFDFELGPLLRSMHKEIEDYKIKVDLKRKSIKNSI